MDHKSFRTTASLVTAAAVLAGLALLPAGVSVAGPGATATITADLATVASSVLAKPLTSSDGIVTIDLSTGNLSVDLAKLMKGPNATDLNGLDPNSLLLTSATIDKVVAAGADALGGLAGNATSAVSAAVKAATTTITVPATLTVATQTSNPTVTVTGTLGGFAGAGGSATPTTTVTGNVLGIPAGTLATALATPVQNAVLVPLKSVTSDLLTGAPGDFATALNKLVTPVVNSLDPALRGVLGNIVQVVINAQSEGDLGATSATVRAISVSLLPTTPNATAAAKPAVASAATVDLASSTVRVGAAAPPPTCGTPAPIVVNGGGKQLQQYSTTGTLVSSATTADVLGDIGDAGGNLYGIPFGGAGAALQQLNVATGATTASIPITGPLASVANLNGMTGLPDGRLLVGAAYSPTLYALNPSTGASTVYPLSLPAGTGSGGDVFLLNDGDLLVSVLAASSYQLIRIHPDNTSTVIGTTPGVFGGAISGGKLYLAGSATAGPIYRLDTILQAASTDPLPLTTLASTGYSIRGAASTQDAAECPTPSFIADPDPVSPGQTLTTDSQGWPSNTEVTVGYTDSAGNPIGAPRTVTTGADGKFTDTLDVPQDTPAGPLTITGSDAAGDTATTTSAVAAPTVPTLTAGPADVTAGDTVTADSQGWPPNSTVTVTYTDVNGNRVGPPHTVTTDADGKFTDTLTVPDGTPPGLLTVTGKNAAAQTAADAVDVVPTPTITADPDPVAPGGTLTSHSDGWPPNTEVTVGYTDSAGNPIGARRTVTTGADGKFTDTLDVPKGTPSGPLTITAKDAAGDTAKDTVTVDKPTITADPDPVPPGGATHIDGAGWPPDTHVTVVVIDDSGNPVGKLQTITTDADGKFIDPLHIPDGTAPGDLTVTATDPYAHTAVSTVTVKTTGGGTGSGNAGNAGTTNGGGQTLASTGPEVNVPAAILASLLMLAAGAALTRTGCRRRHTT